MENLLCDEVWLRSPPVTPTIHDHPPAQRNLYDHPASFFTTKEACEEALAICLQNEFSYKPESGYMELLQSSGLTIARFRAIQWLIKSRTRLNLCFGTLFYAVNYLDRFISVNHFHAWKNWMLELISVACLSLASKFNETFPPSLHEIQMEDLENSFQFSTIQRMELTLLKALGWRLGSTTAFSYVELLISSIDSLKPLVHRELNTRVTELLLGALTDSKFLEFMPSIVAVSALRWSLEELLPSISDTHLAFVNRIIPPDQKDDLVKCQKTMETQLANPSHNLIARRVSCCCPPSPVTVLVMEQADTFDYRFNLSLLKTSDSSVNLTSSRRKRKKEEQ